MCPLVWPWSMVTLAWCIPSLPVVLDPSPPNEVGAWGMLLWVLGLGHILAWPPQGTSQSHAQGHRCVPVTLLGPFAAGAASLPSPFPEVLAWCCHQTSPFPGNFLGVTPRETPLRVPSRAWCQQPYGTSWSLLFQLIVVSGLLNPFRGTGRNLRGFLSPMVSQNPSSEIRGGFPEAAPQKLPPWLFNLLPSHCWRALSCHPIHRQGRSPMMAHLMESWNGLGWTGP